jgi:hypothetical protein
MGIVFGKQLDFVSSVIDAKRQPVNAGVDSAEAQARASLAGQYSKVLMQIIVSCAILIFSFYMIIRSDSSEAAQKAAFGFIGTVVGYWLR